MQSDPLHYGSRADIPERPEPRPPSLALPAVLLLLAVSGALLWLVAGPPRPPSRPDPGGMLAALRGTEISPDAIASWLFAAGWALWTWVALSVLAQAALAALESLTHGARWVRALRLPLDRLSAPFTRRLFPVVTVGLIVAQLAARPAPRAGAAPAPAPLVVALPTASGPGAPTPVLTLANSPARNAPLEHIIAEGDTLLKLAARYYGTEDEYGRLLRANEGRLLDDGTPFVGVLVPGETLQVPLIEAATGRVGDDTIYTVQEGDTLRGIAARLLGDEMRWPEIFAANEGKARLVDGRTLTDPDLIWPGLELVIPGPPPSTVPSQVPPATPSPPAPSPPPPVVTASPTPSPVPSPSPTAVATATPAATPPSMPSPSPSPATLVPSPPAAPLATPMSARATPTTVGGLPIASPAPAGGGGSGTALGVGLGAAVLAAAALLAGREARRRFRAEPAALTPVADGFAEPDLARDFAHRRHGVAADPTAIIAARVARTFAEEGLRDATILAAHHGKGRATLIVDAFSDDRERLVALAPALGARLGGRCEIAPAASGDLFLRLTGLAPLDRLAPETAGGPVLIPLGVLGNREAFHGNWAALGHILIAGLPGGGAETILSGFVAALAAALPPDRLCIRIVARRRTLPGELVALPHLKGEPIDPDDGPRVDAVLAELREELFRRLRDDESKPAQPRPEIVLVVGELTELRGEGDAGTTLELLGREGPARGIRILAATARSEALDAALLPHLATRLVLRLLNEEQSIRLLGLTDATELGEGGWLILRLAGRRPLHPDGWSPLTLRGVRVPPEGLAALVQQMIAAWGGPERDQHAPAPNGSIEQSDKVGPVRLDRAIPGVQPPQSAMTGRVPSGDNGGGKARLGKPTTKDAIQDDEAGENSPPDAMPVRSLIGSAHAHPSGAGGRIGDDGPRPFRPGRDDARWAAREDGASIDRTPIIVRNPSGSTDSPGPPITVRCFGQFEVRHGDRLLDPASGERSTYKAWELLAFLAASPPGPFARDMLIDRLWPDRPLNPRRPANALNHAVSRLRRALMAQVPGLPPDIVRFERDGTYRLNQDLVASDVHRFLALAEGWARLPLAEAVANHREAFALYSEELLGGTGYAWVNERPDDAPSLPERYRAEAREFTLALARRSVREGCADLAAAFYRQLLDAEPTREDFARELFRVYGTLGDRRALLRTHRALRQALRDNPDVAELEDDPALCEPEESTEETFREALAMLDDPVAQRRVDSRGQRVS